ncbi:MAG TPA: hypothetical protein P5572_08860 [Phycisphaerae bacterium]|nr:hypothetical protein [Phycisphaerae bacterium]
MSTLLVAGLLTTVSTADTLASAAGRAQAAHAGTRGTAPATRADLPDASRPESEEGGGRRTVDLGVQPVLLLDRTVKPASVAVPRYTALPVDGGAITAPDSSLRRPDRGFWTANVEWTRQPRPHAGMALLPHGPPAAR